MSPIQDALNRLRAEFVEMPGLRLTATQVQRLCSIDRTMCLVVLGSLVNEGFLHVVSDGAYALATDNEWSRRRPAKAHRLPLTIVLGMVVIVFGWLRGRHSRAAAPCHV